MYSEVLDCMFLGVGGRTGVSSTDNEEFQGRERGSGTGTLRSLLGLLCPLRTPRRTVIVTPTCNLLSHRFVKGFHTKTSFDLFVVSTPKRVVRSDTEGPVAEEGL